MTVEQLERMQQSSTDTLPSGYDNAQPHSELFTTSWHAPPVDSEDDDDNHRNDSITIHCHDGRSTTHHLPPEAVPNHLASTKSPRERLSAFLESRVAHISILVLILLDMAVVLTEIIVTFLEQHNCQPNGEPKEEEEEPAWLRGLIYLSLSILFIFVLEHVLRFAVNGWKYYARSPLHIFDALVVIGSLVAELILRGKAQEVVGLLIGLRLWRLVRVVDGVATAVGEEKNEIISHLRRDIRVLREENEGLRRRNGGNNESQEGTI
ncbi:hypothetical protein DFS34DRAFT_72960 [Phlyctochytrium arcticum]|nr:hypothetical protein DFS34DRAFT_72960 [Phlyctochytrium arcticum]